MVFQWLTEGACPGTWCVDPSCRSHSTQHDSWLWRSVLQATQQKAAEDLRSRLSLAVMAVKRMQDQQQQLAQERQMGTPAAVLQYGAHPCNDSCRS